jgi:hypothetical protein
LPVYVRPNTVNKQYFSTGELKEEMSYLVDNCWMVNTYYKNGNKRSSGKVCDDLKDGYWQEWYADGAIKWKGIYVKGNRSYASVDVTKGNCSLNTFREKLQKDNGYPIRISADKIHPEDLIVASNNGSIKLCDDVDKCDFIIRPERIGDLKLYVYIQGATQKEILCDIKIIISE